MVYHRQLTMDQTEMVETSITAGQLVSNLQSSLIRGGLNDSRRYLRSAKGQLDRIESKIEQSAPEISPTAMRSAEQLADISLYEWERMDVLQRANVIIEHFANGSVYDPLMCGFCKDIEDVRQGLSHPASALEKPATV